VTVVVLTRDEESRVSRALGSLPHGVAILVVDAQSCDRTRELAELYGARVIDRAWNGFVDARRFALAQVTTPWAFALDADEVLDEELGEAILACAGTADGYTVSRNTYFCGKPLRMWSGERLLRLFRVAKTRVEAKPASGGTAELHERYETVTSYWDAEGEGGESLTPNRIKAVWQTLLPHVDRKADDDWGWAAELVHAHGLTQTIDLAALLQPDIISHVRKALDHRYSPGPDRLLDDLLLWQFGQRHIDLTAEEASAEQTPRRDSLQRRHQQMQRYRTSMGF